MTKREKRLQKIRQNPRNVSFDELRQVLEDYGFILQRTKGSHHIFAIEYDEQELTLVIPYKKPHIRPPYVRQSLAAIDKIIEASGDDEDDREE